MTGNGSSPSCFLPGRCAEPGHPLSSSEHAFLPHLGGARSPSAAELPGAHEEPPAASTLLKTCQFCLFLPYLALPYTGTMSLFPLKSQGPTLFFKYFF